jgi:hypothetical protein
MPWRGWNDDIFVRMHAFGMVEGMAEPDIGQAYLEHMSGTVARLRVPQARWNARVSTDDPNELRTAAIAMFSPVIMMGLHQHLLGGRAVAPLDDQSAVQHLSNWLSGAFAESA